MECLPGVYPYLDSYNDSSHETYGWAGTAWPTVTIDSMRTDYQSEDTTTGQTYSETDTNAYPPPIVMEGGVAQGQLEPNGDYSNPDGSWGVQREKLSFNHTGKTVMKLQTGGKAGIQRRSLFCLNATAQSGGVQFYPQWTGHYPFFFPGDPYFSVDPTQITIKGKNLGGDGNLWIALPDNQDIDVTPMVGGVNYYSFTENQQKYRLFVQANNSILEPNHVVPSAKFCVGQLVNFEGVFSPGLPDGSISPIWNYSLDYINNHWTDENGCEEYNIAPFPAESNPSPAWFYNRKTQNGLAYLGMNIHFSNGQKVYLTSKGMFNVYTPSVTWSPSTLYGGFNVSGGLLWLSLGTPSGNNDGAADFQADVNSKFSGDIGITQIINGDEDFGFPDGGLSTDGNLFFDGSVLYSQTQKSLLDRGYGFFERATDLTDCPGCLVGNNYTSIHLRFNDFVRFCPSGSDSIWVTLGKADWGWDAEASYDSSGNAILPLNTAIQPVFTLSNQFPPPCSGVKGAMSITKDFFWYLLFGAP